MELTEQQQAFKADMREFAQSVIEPYAAQMDRVGEYPDELMKKIIEKGLFGLIVPKEYGGLGVDTVSYAVAVEESSRVCGSSGIMIAAHNSLGAFPLVLFGDEQQKQKYLPNLAKGDGLGAFGLTESGAGSDAGATQTTAVKDGNEWVINGSKCFITNSGFAKVIIITAKTEKIVGSKGITSFIVETDTPGFTLGRKENKMGLRGSDTRELFFDNMRVSNDNVLGKEGDGFKQFMITLDGGRISIAAMALGLAQSAFDQCVPYAKSRIQYGKPISEFQAIQWKLADMATHIQCARHLVYHAARLEDAGVRFTKEAAMAKLYASEMATKVAHQAIQIFGGRGYLKEYPLERIYRDVRLCEIGEGTSEIMRWVISRAILKE